MSDKELAALMARARQGANPTDRDRRVVRAALRGRLGVGAAVGVGAAATKATAGVASKGIAALPAIAVVKVAAPVVAAVIGIAAVGAALKQPAGAPAAQSGTPRTVASSLVVAPSTVASAATVSDPPLVPAAAAVESSSATAVSDAVVSRPQRASAAPASGHRPAPATTNAEDPLQPERDAADDLALVRQMQVALRDGDTRRVLALVQEHERRFPASALAPERDGARVLAQCIEADPGKAEVLGQRFLERYPLSPLDARVRATCLAGAKKGQ